VTVEIENDAASGIGSPVIGGTEGSVLFIGTGILLAEDNANFFWDDTNNRLGIGNATPSTPLDVTGTVTGTTIIGANVTTGVDPGHTHTAASLPDVETLTTSLTAGSVVFSDGSTLAEDNANFFWDDSNNRLGLGTVSPVTSLDINGGFAANLVSKTGAYTATTSDHVILCDASGGAFTITLPAASGVTGIIYHIKKTDSSANAVTVDGDASETIDGATTQVINFQYDSMMIICDGSNWHII